MTATLYAFDISNPGRSARLMLERKGVAYRYRKLPPGLHAQIVRMLGFPASTVPALKIDGEKVQGSRELSRWLEQRIPEPSIFPSDPSARLAVEEAERWGDEYLQNVPRFIVRFGGVRSYALRRFIADAEGLPLAGVAAVISLPSAWDLARRRKIDEPGVRRAIRSSRRRSSTSTG